MIGGFKENRENEYYRIYEFDMDRLRLVLDTQYDFYPNVLKVGSFRDDECVDYVPDRLKFSHNDDRIFFTGICKCYCDSGVDRVMTSSNPIRIDTVNLGFEYQNDKWRLSDL